MKNFIALVEIGIASFVAVAAMYALIEVTELEDRIMDWLYDHEQVLHPPETH